MKGSRAPGMLVRVEQVEHLLVVDLEVRGLELAHVACAHAVEERATEARDEAGAGAERRGARRGAAESAGGRRRGGLVRLAAANAGAHHRVRLAGTCSITSLSECLSE